MMMTFTPNVVTVRYTPFSFRVGLAMSQAAAAAVRAAAGMPTHTGQPVRMTRMAEV